MQKKRFRYIPFRFIIAILLALLEVVTIIGIVIAMCYYVPYFYIVALITQGFCILRIAASDDNPDYKVPWLIVVVTLPVVGYMLYFLFYSRKLKKKFIKRLNWIKSKRYIQDDGELLENLTNKDVNAAATAKLLKSTANAHLFTNTRQEYFASGKEMYRRLIADLESAQKFIYMEYFIIDDGEFWQSVLNVLKRKVKEGVEVKVLYDDIGCMKKLPGDYYKTLKSYGVEAALFSYLKGNADSEFNNRNHRKITIIDGKIGYTGGLNIADEYINIIQPFGYWKDTAIRIEGEAVWELTKLFIIDFGISIRHELNVRDDLYPMSSIKESGYLMPFGDGPNPIYKRRVGKSVILNMVTNASKYVWITTPYLIIDNDICTELETAALKGVDVRIIVPHIPDKKIIFIMTRSYYPRLMAAGVKIYEYKPGFIHAKNYLVDDKQAIVGTINLDYRSLAHHFENGVWMYDCTSIHDIKTDMTNTLNACILVKEGFMKMTLLQRFICAIVRVFAPML